MNVLNAAGRLVPTENQGRPLTPYQGVGAVMPTGRKHGAPIRSCRDYPADGDKRATSLQEAIAGSGLKNGGSVSTHHHFRNGDMVAAQVFRAAEALGLRDLVWLPSAVFPCHEELIPLIERGVIRRIEGSLNGPLGDLASRGGLPEWAVLRSHGCRYRAIQDGDLHVDLAVVGAPSCDPFGNMTGASGPSACGVLGFAVADTQYADHVIALTDNLVPFPCAPWQIAGNDVDQVVVVDCIGDPSQIVSGTTQVTTSPERLRIAENIAQFALAVGIVRNGWSFQAGAGGVSLAFTLIARDLMRERGLRAQFVRGGSNRYLVEMLESGMADVLLDGQTFDLEGVRSARENRNHVMTSPFTSYNYHGKGHFASMIDLTALGATEVDLDFNANVVSHSDGRMMHGIGGWQDALFAKCTVLAVPTLRSRVPIVRRELTTFCGPSELIDVVVTERGVAVNPRRTDLIEAAHDAGFALSSLDAFLNYAENLAEGAPATSDRSGDVVGLITWVDGTILDTVHRTSLS
jgi:citrate lyase subunit alpha/citrate CoA-transferase